MFQFFAISTLTPLLVFPSIPVEDNYQEIQQEFQQESIIHNWYAEDSIIQDYVNYAYNIWWIEFVKLIECENGRRDPNRISKTHDYWLCQLNYKYNKKFIN